MDDEDLRHQNIKDKLKSIRSINGSLVAPAKKIIQDKKKKQEIDRNKKYKPDYSTE
jgi:hypothetical protein